MSIGVSKHDDLVDCMCYAENLVQPFYGQTITDSEGNNAFMEVSTSSSREYGYGGEERNYAVDMVIG
jgi:hypothetical protein